MIQMSNIIKRFGTQTVLSEVSFVANDNEIFGLMGPSGAGKTTIINILTNQLDANSGSFSTGASMLETGLMLDSDGMYVRLTCLENLNIFADIYGVPRNKILGILKSVGLEESAKKPFNKLSKGMRQRLGIARAILHKPKVLFLDEPTSGLDPSTARGIHKLIRELCANGTTVFLTTHNMEEALSLCDTVALLYEGKIVEHGAPIEICERHNSFKTVPDLESVFIKLTGAVLE